MHMKKLLGVTLIVSTFLFFSSTAYAAGVARVNAVYPLASGASFDATGCTLLMAAWTSATASPTATYNSVAMTTIINTAANADGRLHIAAILNPSTGSNAVTNSDGAAWGGVMCWSGTDTSSLAAALDGNNFASGNGITALSVTPNGSSRWLAGFWESSNTNSSLNGGPLTCVIGVCASSPAAGDTGGTVSGAQTQNWSNIGAHMNAGLIAIAPPTTTNTFNFWQFFGF